MGVKISAFSLTVKVWLFGLITVCSLRFTQMNVVCVDVEAIHSQNPSVKCVMTQDLGVKKNVKVLCNSALLSLAANLCMVYMYSE